MSDKYVEETIDFARNNPLISVGMLVKVYNYDDPQNPVYCGVGRVKKMTWDAYYMQYVTDIDWSDGKSYTIFASCCERHVGCYIKDAV